MRALSSGDVITWSWTPWPLPPHLQSRRSHSVEVSYVGSIERKADAQKPRSQSSKRSRASGAGSNVPVTVPLAGVPSRVPPTNTRVLRWGW